MRSEAACKAYADAWRKNHTKNNKFNLIDKESIIPLDNEDADSAQ
jgi:hypothetical protein